MSDPTMPWAQRQLAPHQTWPLTNGGGVTVAVVDTGVDAQTPQLAGRVLSGLDVINPGGGRGDSDCFGHGTFVAGLIAAAPAAGTGFAGVAPGVTILPIRVANNADDVTADAIARGIRAAVDNGASVINVSASTTVRNAPLEDSINYAQAHDVVVVASAANSAKQGDPVTYPASYPTAVAVGAVTPGGQRADFSQTGPYLDLVAPGVDVDSIGPRGPGQWKGSGTSYAAPFVAGTAALIRAYHPQLTADQVRRRLELTADHPAARLPDPQFGWGMVNPTEAVSMVIPEETGRTGALVSGSSANPPAMPPLDVGPVVVVAGFFLALVVILAVCLAGRLGPAGHRRRWRRGRIARVVPASDGPSSARSPP
ncbi:type VII secretion-associated serine protease mycosin [Amycolatopsis sp. NPDC049868]|uniref:type VII secretion-associated serine protease mycosin n=1 Tax=Amycolatopsis sp. NPDC049868 TaxID=3363934 RepID=UPI00379B25BC